ncbi:non-ribosomal peptide synthetase [Bordetella genomosp. 8]|nr:amino acid adenylation domain-containing protein [Bordetella genomosp. 8]
MHMPEADPQGLASDVDHLPLSPEQRAIVAAGEARRARVAVVELAGRVDVARLRNALDETAARHDSLRHGYGRVAGYRGPRLLPEAGQGWRWEIRDGAEDAAASPVATWLAAASGPRAALWHIAPDRAVLAVAVPALAADGASMRILLRDLARCYEAPGAGAGDESPFAYTEYIAWRGELDEDADAPAARAYWARYLAPHADTAGPALPACAGAGRVGVRADDAGEAALAPVDGLSASMDLDADLVSALRAVADRMNVTVPVVMHAAWWSVLGRLAGGWRFLGGWQHDCRRDYEMLAGAVGAYEKILPVAIDWEGGMPFSRCAERLAATLARHVEAQEYWPVDAPTTMAHLEAGFQYVDEPEPGNAALWWSPRDMPGPASGFAMALQVGMRAADARLTVAYHATRYPSWAMQALLEQYAALLGHVAVEPDTTIARLRVLDDAARQALLARRGEALDAGTETLPRLIADWARRSPDAMAVRDAGQALTYADLERRVASAARALDRLGARRGGTVALRLPRDAGLMVAMLAAWRCGAAYLPLEPDWPDARCAAIVRAAEPDCVLVAADDAIAGAAAWAPGLPVASHTLLAEGAGAIGHADGEPRDTLALDDIAYVLFTSGSTGEPKGVPITHGQLLNYVASATRAMDLGLSRRWALTGTVAADLGNTALFGALCNGGTLVVASPDDMRDGAAFHQFLVAQRIDGIKIVPSHLEALLDHDDAIVPARVVLGGEAASAALVRRIARLAPDCRVYNHYGPTESTVGVMVHAVALPAADMGVGCADSAAVLPLTRVLGNCIVHVLDADLEPTPVGGIGEIYLGGAQLCAGYLGPHGATAFVEDPHRPGERLYRSGDMACVLPEGAIRLAGRADHQVKIRGHRIEPAEIEARLLALPDVRQAVVLATPSAGGAVLTACVVATVEAPAGASDDAARIAAWRRALADALPEPMIPSHFVRLAAFPRLANGKVDRQALAPLARDAAGQGGGLAATPRDALETVVARRMAELLDRPALGIDDDFFSMGGHSLLVIKLVTRLRKALKVALPPGAVFDHPTAAALAAELRRCAADASALERIAEARVALDDMSPQERAALANRIEEQA